MLIWVPFSDAGGRREFTCCGSNGWVSAKPRAGVKVLRVLTVMNWAGLGRETPSIDGLPAESPDDSTRILKVLVAKLQTAVSIVTLLCGTSLAGTQKTSSPRVTGTNSTTFKRPLRRYQDLRVFQEHSDSCFISHYCSTRPDSPTGTPRSEENRGPIPGTAVRR